MTSRLRIQRSPVRAIVAAASFVFAVSVAFGLAAPPAMGSAPPPAVTITGAAGSPYGNGAVVGIAVGPNSFFAPHSRIEVIECAAPKGVDPVNDTTCDGNTAQSGSVLVASDGSFAIPHYTLYSLPNTALEETSDGIPVCNTTSECVLYIGQNQNDFTAPKVFSAAFIVQPTAGATPVAAHHAPVPGAPVTGVSRSVAAAGASTVDHVAAATTTTTAPATPPSRAPTSPGSSGSSAPAPARPAPAVAADPSSGGLFDLGAVLPWLILLGVLLILIAAVGTYWWRGSER